MMSTRAAMLMFGPQCCWCGECFSRSSSLARHITTPHTFPCNHCQMKFTLKTNLGKHKAACPNKQSSDSSLLKRKSLSLSHTEKKKIKFHAKVKLEDLGSNNNGEETTVSPAPMEEFIDISIGVFGMVLCPSWSTELLLLFGVTFVYLVLLKMDYFGLGV